MFGISVEDPNFHSGGPREEGREEDKKRFVYQTSWGLSTRTIGVMVMIHSDDN